LNPLMASMNACAKEGSASIATWRAHYRDSQPYLHPTAN
jgi:hypothetical protein